MTTPDGSIELPHIEQYSNTPVFNTKAVALQTGVSAPTLRAWERRYALLSPERADNTYRLYSERDIHLIRWLKDRVDAGIAISQAVVLFRHLTKMQRPYGQSGAPQDKALSTLAVSIEPSDRAAPPSAYRETVDFAIDPIMPQDKEHSSFDVAQSNHLSTQYIHIVQNHLIEIFCNLDEQTAHIMMDSLFSLYPLEQICSEIITPTLQQIGERCAAGELATYVEHFASNFFRALLTNRFYVMSGPLSGPLVIIGCAPREVHELAALMLALFLRRSGLRVAYLGQSVETTGLMQVIRKLQPAVICLSATLPAYVPDLVQLGQQIQSLPAPRPTFVFGGQVFALHTELIAQVSGIYIEDNLQKATSKLHCMVQDYTRN